MVTKDQVTELYIAMFQRAPSESEIDYWYNSAQNNGLDIVGLANTMVEAAKNATHLFGLEDLYPQYANYDPNNPDSIKSIIESVYSTIFNKDAAQDPDGVEYWTNEVLNGKSLGEVIVAIEDAAKDIASNPEKYKDVFDEDTLNQAIEAEHAFESKVKAAKEIANQIQNVKTDPQALQKMQGLIKEINDDNDIETVINEITNIKDEIEDTTTAKLDENSELNNNENIEYGDDSENIIDENSDANVIDENSDDAFKEFVAVLSMMSDEDKEQFYNLLKEYFQNEANVYNSNSTYTEGVLNQLAAIENDITKKSNELFSKYNLPVDNGEYVVNVDFLNSDPNKLQEYYNLEKQHYNDLLNALNNINPVDPNSYQTLYAIDNDYENKLDSIIDEWPVYADVSFDDYNNFDYNYDNYYDENYDNNYYDENYVNINYDENDFSQCYQELDNFNQQLNNLDYNQLMSLYTDLSNFENSFYNTALSDGYLSDDETQQYEKGIEDIYAKYGIDVHSLLECGGADLMV